MGTPTINLIAEFNDPIARDILVYYGNIIPARFTEKAPRIVFNGEPNSLYTLALVDAKTPPYLEEYDASIQWLITNIPGKGGDITKGTELVEYLGGMTLPDFGLNRMVFLLFKQREGYLSIDDFTEIKANQLLEREPFDVKEFALQNELLPKGFCFFTCPYDITVKERYESFGFGLPQFIQEEHIQKKIERKERKDKT